MEAEAVVRARRRQQTTTTRDREALEAPPLSRKSRERNSPSAGISNMRLAIYPSTNPSIYLDLSLNLSPTLAALRTA